MRVKEFHGNQNIVKLLDAGKNEFYKVVNQYCSQKGSHNTILGWGSEATFLSIFSQGLIKNNQYCFLEMPFLVDNKKTKKEKEKGKQRIVDALLIRRSGRNALTAIIEAKKVKSFIFEDVTDSKINRVRNAFDDAKKQLQDINLQHIYWDEKFGDKRHAYRIALIFNVLVERFAKSGEGDSLYDNGYTIKEIRDKAKKYFDSIHNEFKGEDNVYTYLEYIHSIRQIKLIRDYYGTTMWTEKGEEVKRSDSNTYYEVGVQVIAANYQ